MVKDRQLCPNIPINYNEMLLKRLHSHLKVRILNNISISLVPFEVTGEDNEDSNVDTNSNSKSDISSEVTKMVSFYHAHFYLSSFQ